MSKQHRGSATDIDIFYYYGVYFSTRTLYIGCNLEDEDDAIDALSSSNAIKGLHLLDIEYNEVVPIQVLINTYGGDTYEAMGIYDAIRYCKNNIITVGIGKVMSAGSIIMQAGDERVMYPNSTFLMHYGSMSLDEKNRDLEEAIIEDKRLNEWQLDLWYRVIKRKKKRTTKAQVHEMLSKDTTYTPKECLELGIIDRIRE